MKKLKTSHNQIKKNTLFCTCLFFLSNLLVPGKGSAYKDKLEFIRSFIVENYPTHDNEEFNIRTQAGYNENFIDFYVKVGELNRAEECEASVDPVLKEWLEFELKVNDEFELFELSVGGSGIDFIEKKKDFFTKSKELTAFDLESIRKLLIKLEAKYPVEPGGFFRAHKAATDGSKKDIYGATIFYENLNSSIVKELVNRNNLWKFAKVNSKKLRLSKNPSSFYFHSVEDSLFLYWHLRMNDGVKEYEVDIEPLSGYIVGFNIFPYAETENEDH